MAIEKVLGKLKDVRLGYGGYQDAMFGVSFSLEGKGCGCGDFWGTWSLDVEVTKHTQWSESDRDKYFADTMRKLNALMKDAKVTTLDKLVGKPIEITFENNTLKSWRILTEVL